LRVTLNSNIHLISGFEVAGILQGYNYRHPLLHYAQSGVFLFRLRIYLGDLTHEVTPVISGHAYQYLLPYRNVSHVFAQDIGPDLESVAASYRRHRGTGSYHLPDFDRKT